MNNKLYLILILLLLFKGAFAQENCNNGIDDNGDGLIDLNDQGCSCTNASIPSLIPNYNFEQMDSCPNDWALFNTVSHWFTPSTATSDYINTCGFVPLSALDAGVYPLPPNNGQGTAGILVSQDYKEFIAVCLDTPLVAGTQYQLNFDVASSTSGRLPLGGDGPNVGQVCGDGMLYGGVLDLTVYGSNNCKTTVTAGTNVFPTGDGWIELGKVRYLPSKAWGQLSIVFTPVSNIKSIMIGAPQSLPDSYVNEYDYHGCFAYFYFDNARLNKASLLGLRISAAGAFCDNTLVLTAEGNVPSGQTYQWFKNGIAIAGATSSSLAVNYATSAVGDYQVRSSGSGACMLSPKYNVQLVADVPEYTFVQSPCFPGFTDITITTAADQYSFDGGETWTINPVLTGLRPSDRIYLALKKNGCISNVLTVVLEYPPLETISPPQLEVVQPGCNTNGSITVTTPALEYSFDDGVTWGTNPILDNLPPSLSHVYKVRIRTLLGCITGYNSEVMQPFFFAEPEYTTVNYACGIGGSLTITTQAHEYSFDNGNTWTTSNSITNLLPSTHILKTRSADGCVSRSVTAVIAEDFIDRPSVTFIQPSCGSLGTIGIATNASMYSFDNGATWQTSNVKTGLTGGFYYTRIKDFQNCQSLATVVYIQEYLLDIEPEYVLQYPHCGQPGAITITTPASEYSFDGGATWGTSAVASNLSPGYYKLRIRNGVYCESGNVYVYLDDFSNVIPDVEIVDAGCNSFGSITITTSADEYSFDNGITWSSNNTVSNLSGNMNFTIKAKTGISCYSLSRNVVFNSTFIPAPAVNDYIAGICDIGNDATEAINLTQYNPYLIANHAAFSFRYFTTLADAEDITSVNEIANPSTYEISHDSTVYVRVTSPQQCHSTSKIVFYLLSSPVINSISDKEIVCVNNSVTLDAGLADGYLWSTQQTSRQINISNPGNYSLTVFKNYGDIICSTVKNFIVVASGPAQTIDINIDDWTINDNIITVNASGAGDYQYSIDGIRYQDANQFSNLPPGVYKVFVKDKNECGIIDKDIALLAYPKFFTPNGDGKNDVWSINFSVFEPKLELTIFDRYGKTIAQLAYNESWDGTHNGRSLPATDYWFTVKRAGGKIYKGHFSLIR